MFIFLKKFQRFRHDYLGQRPLRTPDMDAGVSEVDLLWDGCQVLLSRPCLEVLIALQINQIFSLLFFVLNPYNGIALCPRRVLENVAVPGCLQGRVSLRRLPRRLHVQIIKPLKWAFSVRKSLGKGSEGHKGKICLKNHVGRTWWVFCHGLTAETDRISDIARFW
jgi:hypothetical protein